MMVGVTVGVVCMRVHIGSTTSVNLNYLMFSRAHKV